MPNNSTRPQARRNSADYIAHCTVLGVSPAATREEINEAYRSLAKTFHPDIAGVGSVANFKRVQESYEQIRDVAPSRPRQQRRSAIARPPKPYPEFPLFAHISGRWGRKIRSRVCYFGRWGNVKDGRMVILANGGEWKQALALHDAQIHDLRAGRIPRTVTRDDDGLHLKDLLNAFLTFKLGLIDSGELSPRTYREYKEACTLLATTFGTRRLVDDLRPNDFEKLRAKMTKHWGPSRVGKFVQMIRTTFKYGMDNGLIDKPVLFGSGFKKPTKALMRKHKAAGGKKLFAVDELRTVLDALDGALLA